MNALLLVLISVGSLLSQADSVEINVFEQDQSSLKALVFLSDDCPCSRSHIEHLNKIASSGVKLYGVISEPVHKGMSEARRKQLETYFETAGFEFPILKDPAQTLVKKYGALKTPHATLFQKGEGGFSIVYQGGVTNQKEFEKSTIRYLEANLTELQAGRAVKYKNGHSLGCYIRRI